MGYDISRSSCKNGSETYRNSEFEGLKQIFLSLENVVKHQNFITGDFNTSFIDSTPELFMFPTRKDRGTKLLNYIGNVTVNGFPGIEKQSKPIFAYCKKT